MDRAALVRAAGAQFEQHLARLQLKTVPRGEIGRKAARFLAPLRRTPEMQADADRLALDQQAGLVVGKGVEGGFRRIHGGGAVGRFDRAVGARELQPVRAGQQKGRKAKLP